MASGTGFLNQLITGGAQPCKELHSIMVMPFRLADVMMEEQVLCAVGVPAKHCWQAHVFGLPACLLAQSPSQKNHGA